MFLIFLVVVFFFCYGKEFLLHSHYYDDDIQLEDDDLSNYDEERETDYPVDTFMMRPIDLYIWRYRWLLTAVKNGWSLEDCKDRKECNMDVDCLANYFPHGGPVAIYDCPKTCGICDFEKEYDMAKKSHCEGIKEEGYGISCDEAFTSDITLCLGTCGQYLPTPDKNGCMDKSKITDCQMTVELGRCSGWHGKYCMKSCGLC